VFLLAETGAENPLLRVSPGLALWTLIVFVLVFLALRKWGFGPLISKLDARDRAIRGAIEEARKHHEEAEQLLRQQQELLRQARRDSAQMLGAAQEQAERERQRIIAEARAECERVIARGRAQIDQETRAAVTQLRRTTAALALEVAGKLMHRTMDQPAHKELAEQFVKELEKM
jgi:F-type H+-transporting ATPase subunit b